MGNIIEEPSNKKVLENMQEERKEKSNKIKYQVKLMSAWK